MAFCRSVRVADTYLMCTRASSLSGRVAKGFTLRNLTVRTPTPRDMLSANTTSVLLGNGAIYRSIFVPRKYPESNFQTFQLKKKKIKGSKNWPFLVRAVLRWVDDAFFVHTACRVLYAITGFLVSLLQCLFFLSPTHRLEPQCKVYSVGELSGHVPDYCAGVAYFLATHFVLYLEIIIEI